MGLSMVINIDELCETVKFNCDIADARHAGDYTLCTYLMKMRELYRWEQGYAFDVELKNDDVGQWVRDREEYWEAIEAQAYASLPIAGDCHDPFEQASVNQYLLPEGFVYSSGLGQKSAAHFFLAKLDERRTQEGFEILIAGKEFARDLASPPAMTRGDTIFIRRESLRRWLWERVQEWQWNRCEGALGRALASYPIDDNIERTLDDLVEDQLQMVLLHEIGEHSAGQGLESDWQALLMAVSGTRAELELRAVRDNLADAKSTLPALLQQPRPELLHFYFAVLSPLRRKLYPALMVAYESWCQSGSTDLLEESVARGESHWAKVMQAALQIYQQEQKGCASGIVAMVEHQTRVFSEFFQ